MTFAPDSWVKLILISALAIALLMLTSAVVWRAVHSDFDIQPGLILDVIGQFTGLFGVVVGYVLGSKSRDG